MPIELSYIAGMKQDVMSTTFEKCQIGISLDNFHIISMSEVGPDLWRSFGSNPPLKWDPLEPVAQDCVQTPFEYLQE